MQKNRSFWLMLWLAILVIICGFITTLNPWLFWNFLDIVLWIFLIFSGISAIINAVKNQNIPLISFLFAIWILITILWFILIFSKSEFVWKIMIRMFALWAFMRWVMLVFFSLQNKEKQIFRWAFGLLWILLVILAIITAFSKTATNIAWICIGISIIFDGLSLLYFTIKWIWKKSIQNQIITQAEWNEIAQWEIIIWETIKFTKNKGQTPDE